MVQVTLSVVKVTLTTFDQSKKDLIVILMSATVTLAKKYFQRTDLAFIDLKTLLLQFNLYLLEVSTKRNDFKIEEIYPKEYSLCSSVLREPSLSLKNFGLCVKSIKILVQHNKNILKNSENTKFLLECAKRLLEDVKFLINIYSKLELPFQ